MDKNMTPEALSSVADIMRAQLSSARAARGEAIIRAIRLKVTNLYAKPWIPHPDLVLAALWPTEEEIRFQMRAGASKANGG